MKINNIIQEIIKDKKSITTKELATKTGFSRNYVQKILKQLVNKGELVLIGSTNKAKYLPATNIKKIQQAQTTTFSKTFKNKNLQEDKILNLIAHETSIFNKINKNEIKIIDYCFLEILNNAIEHSQSKNIKIQMQLNEKNILFKITDYGIGIFKNIMTKKNLANIEQAIETLLKGKQTTAPKEHTGQDIFFTSKIADLMKIESSNKKIIFSNINNEYNVLLDNSKVNIGSKVTFILKTPSAKNIIDIFKKYTNDNLEFSTTKFPIKVLQLNNDAYYSRSEARRLLIGLEQFEKIILDYSDVSLIGQSFADEIYRVWQNKYPKIKIESINTDDNVNFMINYSLNYKNHREP